MELPYYTISYSPFTSHSISIHVTHGEVAESFAEFKTKLWSYEDAEKMCTMASDDNVMKVREHLSSRPATASTCDWGAEGADIVCFFVSRKDTKQGHANASSGVVSVKAPHIRTQPADRNSGRTTQRKLLSR